jgi:nucleoside phosphorylase
MASDRPLLIVAAMPMEVRGLLAHLQQRQEVAAGVFSGRLEGKDLLLALTGVGPSRLEGVLQAALERGPAAVLTTGLAGAIDPAVQPDVLCCASSFRLSTSAAPEIHSSHALAVRAERVCFQAGLPYTTRPFLSVQQALLTPEEKRAAFEASGAGVVDMESYWVADLALRWETPVTGVRIVLDGADSRLPPLVQRVDMERQTRSSAAYLAVRPWQTPGVMRLAWQTRQAARHLDRFLATFVREWEGIP